MSLVKPYPTNNLSAVMEREFFLVKDNDLDKLWTCMIVYRTGDQITLLLVDHTMDGNLRGTRIGTAAQRRFEFVRYLTTDEVVTISGTDVPSREEASTAPVIRPAEIVDGFDISGIPTVKEVQASKDVQSIPDGIAYTMQNRHGSLYQCVNCPPGKGYAANGKVRTITVSGGPDHAGWMPMDGILRESGWTFIDYADPTKLHTPLVRYIDGMTVGVPLAPDASQYPTDDVIREQGMGAIPDGVFYLARYGTGAEYYCVNCPPMKGYITRSTRMATQINRGSQGLGWSVNIVQGRPHNGGWTFVRYVREDEVPDKLKRYPKR